MSIKKKAPIMKENEIPGKVRKKSNEWAEWFLTIPRGHAMALTQEHVDVKLGTIKTVVSRLVDKGMLPPNFYAVQRTVGNKVFVYVVNSAKGEYEEE